MRILVVCKYNRFRSKLAEHYLKLLFPYYEVCSAGIIKGRPLDKQIKRFFKDQKIAFSNSRNTMSEKLIKSSDVIIIVADDVPRELFSKGKVFMNKQILFVSIEDTSSDNYEKMCIINNNIKKCIENEIYLKIKGG